MRGLGYDRFGAHGGDLGGGVTARLGQFHPDAVAGIHVTNVYGEVSDGIRNRRGAQLPRRSRRVGNGPRVRMAPSRGRGRRRSRLGCGFAVELRVLDRREIPGVVRLRRRHRERVQQRRPSDQHHDLLGDRHHRLLLPPVLGQPKQRQPTAVVPDRGSMRSGRVPARHRTAPTVLRRALLQHHPLGRDASKVDTSPRWSSPRLSPPRSERSSARSANENTCRAASACWARVGGHSRHRASLATNFVGRVILRCRPPVRAQLAA